ncbi:unnamed protein product, partial [Prorocentrum cordatum]
GAPPLAPEAPRRRPAAARRPWRRNTSGWSCYSRRRACRTRRAGGRRGAAQRRRAARRGPGRASAAHGPHRGGPRWRWRAAARHGGGAPQSSLVGAEAAPPARARALRPQAGLQPGPALPAVRAGRRAGGRWQEAFVVVVSNETTVTVEIAEPAVIVAAYVIMFVPLGVGWAAMLHFGTQAKHYMILLPMTYVTIALDLVNQSLSALMGAPMSITAIQALCLAMIAGTWALAKELVYPYMCLEVLQCLRPWTVVAVLFSGYQLINHLVSLYCSLSERTVFYGITPVAMVVTELVFLPASIKTHFSFNSKLAMVGMLVGAGLFAVQYPDFTALGVLSATGMVATQVPYRLFQRWNLAECMVAPLAVLACYDGLFLFVPAFVLADVSLDAFWASWEGWLSDPSVALLLLLSSLVLTFHHILGLALLRVTSATATMI